MNIIIKCILVVFFYTTHPSLYSNELGNFSDEEINKYFSGIQHIKQIINDVSNKIPTIKNDIEFSKTSRVYNCTLDGIFVVMEEGLPRFLYTPFGEFNLFKKPEDFKYEKKAKKIFKQNVKWEIVDVTKMAVVYPYYILKEPQRFAPVPFLNGYDGNIKKPSLFWIKSIDNIEYDNLINPPKIILNLNLDLATLKKDENRFKEIVSQITEKIANKL